MTLERSIVHGQRNISATAYDAEGHAIASQEMNTGSAKTYLGRDASATPPGWKELEDIAANLLTLQLEE